MHFLSLDFKLRFLKKTAINRHLKTTQSNSFFRRAKRILSLFLQAYEQICQNLDMENRIMVF